MTFNINSFTKELYEEYQDYLSIEEVEELLGLNEAYNKDTPLSTGKRLVLEHISFFGMKDTEGGMEYSGDVINYKQRLQTGINIWIADNLKGKSSIFKIIKYALTGSSSLKPNIKKWIKHILLNFRINDKEYTIYLNTEKKSVKASLLNGVFTDLEELNNNDAEPLFEAIGEPQFQDHIQDFFFKQFSYYSLRWTQKHPGKDKNELLEVGASWSTYFKSILLESKDSNEMYGSQGKKVFQMLLGLELTYPINQLSIKRDLLIDEKGKQQLFLDRQIKKQGQEKDKLKEKLAEINNLISEYNQKNQDKVNISELYNEYNSIVEQIRTENNKSKMLENEFQTVRKELDIIQKQKSTNEYEVNGIAKEIEKNKKRIADLTEYMEIGIFFSNLDIKHCPSCSHSISEDKKKLELKEKKCAVCNEKISTEEVELDRDIYIGKIENLNKANDELEKENEMYRSIINQQEIQYQKTLPRILEIEGQKENLIDTTYLQEQLKQIEQTINAEKEKVKPIGIEQEELISQKAVAEYQLKELDKSEVPEIVNFDYKIKLLATAIERLNERRYQLGQKVLNRLTELMLAEIHQFGLNSITEISVTDKFDIQYKQDGDFISWDDIAEGEQLRAKIAFYLSLIQLDIENNFGRHTRFLMIDSPGKEEADISYLEGLSGVLKSIETRFGNSLQILIGTAERGLSNVVENEFITPQNTYVF